MCPAACGYRFPASTLGNRFEHAHRIDNPMSEAGSFGSRFAQSVSALPVIDLVSPAFSQ